MSYINRLNCRRIVLVGGVSDSDRSWFCDQSICIACKSMESVLRVRIKSTDGYSLPVATYLPDCCAAHVSGGINIVASRNAVKRIFSTGWIGSSGNVEDGQAAGSAPSDCSTLANSRAYSLVYRSIANRTRFPCSSGAKKDTANPSDILSMPAL